MIQFESCYNSGVINAQTPLRLTERNPNTQRMHRRQAFWQIAFPLAMGVLIVLALAIMAGLAGAESASRWADISLIFLLIPVMVLTLLFLGMIIGLVYGLTRLSRVVPFYAWRAQELIFKVSGRAQIVSDRAVEPVLRVHSWLAAIRALRVKAK